MLLHKSADNYPSIAANLAPDKLSRTDFPPDLIGWEAKAGCRNFESIPNKNWVDKMNNSCIKANPNNEMFVLLWKINQCPISKQITCLVFKIGKFWFTRRRMVLIMILGLCPAAGRDDGWMMDASRNACVWCSQRFLSDLLSKTAKCANEFRILESGGLVHLVFFLDSIGF